MQRMRSFADVRDRRSNPRREIGHYCWAKKTGAQAAILVLIVFSLVQSTAAEEGHAELPKYVQTGKEDAEYALTLTCSLEGVFSSHKHTFYLRARQGVADMGLLWTSGGNADGQGIGHSYSASIEPLNTAVQVEISVYWTSKGAQGTSRVLLLVPHFQGKEGRDAGFSYSVYWEKLK